MKSIDRRRFLGSSGTAAAAVSAASYSRVKGANERIAVAVVGVRGRGKSHIRAYAKLPGAEVAAVVDIDQAVGEKAAAYTKQYQDRKPKEYRDLREMLKDKSIDAVSIATTNHWHALATIWACQAGKDVYVEKPASHNIFEGRKMIEAARKYNRIVQCGMQSRSTEHKNARHPASARGRHRRSLYGQGPVLQAAQVDRQRAAQFDSDGRRLRHLARSGAGDRLQGETGSTTSGTGTGISATATSATRASTRWISRAGASAKTPCRRPSSPPADTSSTTMTSRRPITQTALFDYPDSQLVFEVRGLLTGGEANLGDKTGGMNTVGNLFFGSEGYMSMSHKGFWTFLGEKRELGPSMFYAEDRGWSFAPHFANFLKAVKSRKHTDLHCDIVEGHLSAALCHMANTSYRTKQRLDFDAKAERYVNNDEANKHLKRDYRKPYVVPEEV